VRNSPLILLFAATAAGCRLQLAPDQPQDDWFPVRTSDCPTQGAAHHAAFSYAGGARDALFGYGCAFLNTPMGLSERAITVGGDAPIEVVLDGDVGYAGVASSAPEVATFSMGKLWFEKAGVSLVTAHGVSAGQADLLLLDAKGAELDRATVRVDVPDGVGFSTISSTLAVPLLLEGATSQLAARALKGGALLVGHGAVRFEPIGPVTLAPANQGTELYDQIVTFHGTPGPAGVRATVGAASRDVSFEIVGAGDLTKFVLGRGNSPAVVTVQGFAGERPVTGVGCGWSIDPRDDLEVAELDMSWLSGPFGDTRSYNFQGPGGVYSPICLAPGWQAIPATVILPEKAKH
jgi:hypothetical protein